MLYQLIFIAVVIALLIFKKIFKNLEKIHLLDYSKKKFIFSTTCLLMLIISLFTENLQLYVLFTIIAIYPLAFYTKLCIDLFKKKEIVKFIISLLILSLSLYVVYIVILGIVIGGIFML